MYSLLKPIVKWIINKCILLIGVSVILVIGLWVKSEWKSISDFTTELGEIDRKTTEETSRLAELRQQLTHAVKIGNEVVKKYQSLDAIATAAESAYKQLDDETPLWHHALLSEKAAKRDLAGKAAKEARAVADAFRNGHTDSERLALENKIDDSEKRLKEFQSERTRDDRPLVQRLVLSVRESLPVALGIVAAAIIVPCILRVVLYFLVAPWVDRVPPVRLSTETSVPSPSFTPSAVSHEIEISPALELVVRPEFLQSSTKPSKKRTRFFLNPSLPFSSAFSGMLLLTSIRSEGNKSTRAVISATKDAFSEVGLVTLPKDASMVMQPRALAGVVKPLGMPVQISSEWRLGSLHGWLTFQLRYLVFHGPCTLILKGCRGVKAESPSPETPRLINQSATLGFSTHLDYSNTRSETFVSYFTGKEDLFNDQFAGQNGLFVYEEMPDPTSKSGLTGRSFEGLVDGLLKVFGI